MPGRGEGEQGDKENRVGYKIKTEGVNEAQMGEVAQILQIVAPGEKLRTQSLSREEGKNRIFFYHAHFKINFL